MNATQICLEEQRTEALAPSRTSGLWRSITRTWQGLATAYDKERRHRLDVEALSHLDDHELRDIGLTRHQINYGRLPTTWLSSY